MKRNKKRVLVAVLAICALAAGGAAFTAGISGLPTSPVVAGFNQTKITGAEASGTAWNLSTDGQYVQTVTVTLKADGSNGTTAGDPLPHGTIVDAGFDSTTDGSNGTASLINCTRASDTDVDWTCDFQAADTTNHVGVAVQDAHVFDVSVTDSTSTGVPTS
jgi:hypothetical protein